MHVIILLNTIKTFRLTDACKLWLVEFNLIAISVNAFMNDNE